MMKIFFLFLYVYVMMMLKNKKLDELMNNFCLRSSCLPIYFSFCVMVFLSGVVVYMLICICFTCMKFSCNIVSRYTVLLNLVSVYQNPKMYKMHTLYRTL